MWYRSLCMHWFVLWRQAFSLRKEGNACAIVTTFPELVLCFGALYMRFCTMGFANSLLLKEAVPLLAACYYNSSFAGSVLAWLVNQLCSENWQNPFSCWVSFLLGYWAEWARQRLGWVRECCKTLGGMCCWRWYCQEKTEELLIFLPHCPLGIDSSPSFVEPCFCVLVTMCDSAQTQLLR